MEKREIEVAGEEVPLREVHTLVVGSGAASLNAALHLDSLGVDDLLVVTREMGGGTSNNAGSDKQTYYKLSLAGEEADSVREMARTYYEGGAMHGDLALIESALSAREFFHLVELGVEFPFSSFGEYPGYKTDHDPKGRGTSAGPWTSQEMFARLADEVEEREIGVREGVEIVSLLTAGEGANDGREKRVVGALALDLERAEEGGRAFLAFRCENVVFGVGGPGGLYRDSVYPKDHLGSIGVALEAGAVADSLPEAQFGLASTDFRWNLSGSYQQVIPRYFSTDEEGGEEEEFLKESFSSFRKLTEAIFLKGYQWPFDPGKIADGGSSLIDLLVYVERKLKGRRVFLDYRKNPSFGEEEFALGELPQEAHDYLRNSDALRKRPIDRLKAMNPQAVELYRENGIDLESEPLEIAVCAQHNNGGLKGNEWWESNLSHLFPVGEVNGSHGVSRPGGSALNAGQVGGLRAAQYVGARYDSWTFSREEFLDWTEGQIEEKLEFGRRSLSSGSEVNPWEKVREEIQERMSRAGAHVRRKEIVGEALREAKGLTAGIKEGVSVDGVEELPQAFRTLQLAVSHLFYLEAIRWYVEEGGGSRGSYVILDEEGEREIALPLPGSEKRWRYREEREDFRSLVQETYREEGTIKNRWVSRREIPAEDLWFESVWQDYREGKVFE